MRAYDAMSCLFMRIHGDKCRFAVLSLFTANISKVIAVIRCSRFQNRRIPQPNRFSRCFFLDNSVISARAVREAR
jgi:hypothetical protein